MATPCILYDFSKLRGRIREKLGSEKVFADKIGRTQQYVSMVFNGRAYFTAKDITNALSVPELELELNDIGQFFYAQNLHKCVESE